MNHRRIALFDIDGTITESRQDISHEMKEFLLNIQSNVDIGFVGGASYEKHRSQLGEDCKSIVVLLYRIVVAQTAFLFSQNGTSAYKHNVLFHQKYITDIVSNSDLNRFISFILRYLSDLDIPCKRGTFIEFRTCMINICPIGHDASVKERKEFENLDNLVHVRETMIEALRHSFGDLNFSYLIGGQTSFDVVPAGMDKTYCLQFLGEYDEIHFFGDKVQEGGNDYEIFEDPRTIGYHVHGPAHTRSICESLFCKNT